MLPSQSASVSLCAPVPCHEGLIVISPPGVNVYVSPCTRSGHPAFTRSLAGICPINCVEKLLAASPVPCRWLRGDLVGVSDVNDLPRQEHVAGQARLAERDRLGQEARFISARPELPGQKVVLDNGGTEPIPLADKEGPRLGMCPPPGFAENPLEKN